MQRMTKAAALTVMLGMSNTISHEVAFAAEAFTLTQDILPSEGYGSNPPDILGVQFGESREDAIANIEAAIPGLSLQESVIELTLRDNRGNSVAVDYVFQAQGSVSLPDRSEQITLRFTSEATGARVWGIERTIRYQSDSHASMAELRASIAAKYGEPTVTELYAHQNYDEITYTWEKREVPRFGEQDVQGRSFNADPARQDVCLRLPGSNPYIIGSGRVYTFVDPGRRKGNPGWDACIGALRFTIYYGNNETSVRQIKIVAIDHDRATRDARHMDQILSDMLGAKANEVSGQGAPKL